MKPPVIGCVANIAREGGNETPILEAAFCCFQSDDFLKKINEIGRDVLILSGIEIHICVAQTAMQAPIRRIHVVSDATSSLTTECRPK